MKAKQLVEKDHKKTDVETIRTARTSVRQLSFKIKCTDNPK